MTSFDDTNENEIFNRLNEELHRSNGGCGKMVLLQNISAGSQIDALLIRATSIVVIEMKNYSGDIVGPENGEWYCSAGQKTIQINPGRENPFLQVKKYRGNVVDKIKRGAIQLGDARSADLEDRWIQFVSGLVIFTKIRSFNTDIDSNRVKWFRCTDIDGAAKKLSEIGSTKMELTEEEIDVVAKMFTQGIAKPNIFGPSSQSNTAFGTRQSLEEKGFQGFLPVGQLRNGCGASPDEKGVYAVLHMKKSRPRFLPRGSAPDGEDVAVSELENKWVPDAELVYLGKTDNSLRKRLRQYMRFGTGKDAPHRGGRYIWQIENNGELIVCWKALDGQRIDGGEIDPREYEKSLLQEFKKGHHGSLPFANINE